MASMLAPAYERPAKIRHMLAALATAITALVGN